MKSWLKCFGHRTCKPGTDVGDCVSNDAALPCVLRETGTTWPAGSQLEHVGHRHRSSLPLLASDKLEQVGHCQWSSLLRPLRDDAAVLADGRRPTAVGDTVNDTSRTLAAWGKSTDGVVTAVPDVDTLVNRGVADPVDAVDAVCRDRHDRRCPPRRRVLKCPCAAR